ncbi:hypothetical protein DL98DRAFT_529980 [Cadophora sp. DSE1049]|nr:hypothetical protein DL98DRAFT_529980 [Cadophora sp. DSE1049]
MESASSVEDDSAQKSEASGETHPSGQEANRPVVASPPIRHAIESAVASAPSPAKVQPATNNPAPARNQRSSSGTVRAPCNSFRVSADRNPGKDDAQMLLRQTLPHRQQQHEYLPVQTRTTRQADEQTEIIISSDLQKHILSKSSVKNAQ